MKKFTVLLLFLISTGPGAMAQKELWGTVSNNGQYGYGYIFKTNANGDSLQIVHHFDSLAGKSPKGLLPASNGKLYGLTSNGGVENRGVLYEYDLVLSKFKVLQHFGNYPEYAQHVADTRVGLTEGTPGVLYGQATTLTAVPAAKGAIFAYTIATDSLKLAVRIPTFMGGAWNEIQNNSLYGPLHKAADGFLYGTTGRNSTCPIGSPNQGSIVRFNPANNTLSIRYLNPCSSGDGFHYRTSFIEEGGKLYSIARGGIGFSNDPGHQYGNGVIYEFNTATNAYTVKHVFQGGLKGLRPEPMIRADNGKWYGTAGGGLPQPPLASGGAGMIYEFDPATDSVTNKYNFLVGTSSVNEIGYNPFGMLTKASNGKLYGSTSTGIFEYNTANAQVRPAARWPLGQGGQAYDPFMIEICRKPAYQSFEIGNYTLCEGSFFHHDLKCLNATGTVWKWNGTIMTSQTGSVLEFAAVTHADTGTWVAELSNSCGTTIVPPIKIAVNTAEPGTVTSAISPAGTHLICKGNSITLSGNTGGSWNTAANANSISVTEPGSYRVSNTNACGTTYSNIITVDTIPSPIAPVITGYNFYFCRGDSLLLSGNTNGIWNTGENSYSIYVKEAGTYYVITSNQCSSDTSNRGEIPASYIFDPLDPKITGDTVFCTGSTVPLFANDPLSSWTYSTPDYSSSVSLGTGGIKYVNQPGYYKIFQSNYGCGSFSSKVFELKEVTGPPAAPVINPSGPLSFCMGDSVVLEASVTSGIMWNTGETTASVTIDRSGVYSVSASNVCGTSASEETEVTVNPLPVITYEQTPSTVCISDPAFNLGNVSPPGGSFDGTGVTDYSFSPAAAGSGTHSITYSYTDLNFCRAEATQFITVHSYETPKLITPGGIDSYCEGTGLFMYQIDHSSVKWSTGDTAYFIYINEPGRYSYTATTACGILSSDTLMVTERPLPDAGVTQSGNVLEANAINANYRWIDCENNNLPIEGATNRTFLANAQGSYAVIVTANNCEKTSDCYSVITGDLEYSAAQMNFSVFPNPAAETLQIITDEEILWVTVLNLTGQKVLEGKSKQLNVSGLAAGIYILSIETNQGIRRKKFTKL